MHLVITARTGSINAIKTEVNMLNTQRSERASVRNSASRAG